MNIELKTYKHIVETKGWNAIDLTEIVEDIIKKTKLVKGLAHVFIPEKKCIITFTEYEPNLPYDLEKIHGKIYRMPGNT